jgi:hypothetical protein
MEKVTLEKGRRSKTFPKKKLETLKIVLSNKLLLDVWCSINYLTSAKEIQIKWHRR